MTARRIAREYLAQIFAFAITMFDRLVLVGVLIRLWGVDMFAAWTVALSVAGMVAIFDFGLNLYFGNRLFFAVEQGEKDRARHILGAGNFALACASLFGAVAVILLYMVFRNTDEGVNQETTLLWAVIILAVATAARQAMAAQYAVYRAHQQFFRQTMIFSLGDLLRIVTVIAAVALGGDLVAVSFTYLGAIILFSVLLPIWDTARFYPEFRFGFALPDAEERQRAIGTSLQYWVQSAVSTAITFAPTFLLGASGAGAFVIAQFALMRTLANLVRSVLQLFTNVFGLEAARRIALNDTAGLTGVYRESTQFLAIQMAGTAGMLAALAEPLFGYWTGNPALYNTSLFWLAIGAPLLLPTLSMALQLLVCANQPRALVTGRLAQLAITILMYFIMPFENVALRMMAALAIGEIIGLGAALLPAVVRVVPGSGLALHVDLAARSIFTGVATYLVASSTVALAKQGSIIAFIGAALLSGVALAVCTWFLGMSKVRRIAAQTALSKWRNR